MRLRNMQREGGWVAGGGAILSRGYTFAFVGVAEVRYLIWQVQVCRLRPEKVLQQLLYSILCKPFKYFVLLNSL